MRAFIIYAPDEILNELGEQIRAMRLRQNVTQNELALRVGASLSSIRRLESAGQGTLSLLVNVAIALNVSHGMLQIFRAPDPSSIAQLAAAAAQPTRRRARSVGQGRSRP